MDAFLGDCVEEILTVESSLQPQNLTHTRAQNNRGFTLVELLVVVVIIGILASLAFASFARFKEMARIARCCDEIRTLEKEITAYASEKGVYPPSLTELNRQNLKDPWGNLYKYAEAAQPVARDNVGPDNRTYVALTINSDFDLYSTGPDGAFAPSITDDLSMDDIIRAKDGSFVGGANQYVP